MKNRKLGKLLREAKRKFPGEKIYWTKLNRTSREYYLHLKIPDGDTLYSKKEFLRSGINYYSKDKDGINKLFISIDCFEKYVTRIKKLLTERIK